MSNKKTKKKQGKGGNTPTPVLKNPIILTVAITLAALLVFGAVSGIVIGVRNGRALLSYGGTRVERSAASYLAATYKATYLDYLWDSGILYADDTAEFWAEEAEDGKTYGDLLRAETDLYLRQTVAGAYQFDRYFTLTRDDKELINAAAEDVLANVADGDKRAFNKLAEPMGFDYGGFVDALTLLYKTEQARIRLYGTDGSTLANAAYASECEKYFSTFAYAKLLFIRTEYEYETDENGEFIRDENGNFVTRPLTNEEKTVREADLAEIRAAIAALESGADDQMSEGFFNSMLAKYDLDDYTLTGYFFAPAATYTQGFMTEVSAEVVSTVYETGVGEYAEVATDYGTCFIYRGQLISGAYSSTTFEVFFTDFYSDAANYLYLDAIVSVSDSVEVKDNFYDKVDVVALPYNWEIILRSGFGS